MTKAGVDHITERVVTSAFRSICEEMGHTMLRTANSSVFTEGRDFSCAIVGPDAELVAAANFDPSHLSAMALTVEFAVLYFGPDNIAPGDVYLVNDPYRGGGHLPDITLIRPVFVDEDGVKRLLGFAVNRAHHIDIGGMAVAGFPGSARSIFQEGFRIPPVRWFAGGVENRDVIEMITLNMRFPRDQLGDFQAQLASTRTAEQRLARLAGRYGTDVVLACMEESKNHAEALMRAVLREIPDGTYRFTEWVDDDGATDTPYRIEVAVSVAGGAVTVDYTGSSPQATGPINSSYGNTLSSTFNALLQLVGPEVPFNSGCFRPITVIAPRGSLLNPVPPAPCFGGVTELSIRIIDAILGALAPVASARVGAASYGTCINFSGGGFDTERDQPFGFYFFLEGGWGASAWRDGWSATPNPTSNFNDYPVEWVEATLPLRYREARLNTDSGGPGRWRGGVGTVRTVEVLADSIEINALGERFRIAPYGLAGGDPGACNALLTQTAGANDWQDVATAHGTASPSKFHGVTAHTDVCFSIVSGGGGGYGPALNRPPAEVLRDVIYGYVSRDGARDDYGVVIIEATDGSLAVDEAETTGLRSTLAGQPRPRHQARDAALAALSPRAASGPLSPQAAAEVAAVKAKIAAHRERAAGEPGASLESPFRNARALAYWDTDALDRWLARHRRDV